MSPAAINDSIWYSNIPFNEEEFISIFIFNFPFFFIRNSLGGNNSFYVFSS